MFSIGVPGSMMDKDLYHFFESFGLVEYAIVLNKKTSRYGFVTFVSVESAKSALAAANAVCCACCPSCGQSSPSVPLRHRCQRKPFVSATIP